MVSVGPRFLVNYQFYMIWHYNDIIMGAKASQITSLTSVYSIVYSSEDQRKHQSSASLAFVQGIHRGPVNSPHKWPVTRKMFPFDDAIMDNVQINPLMMMLKHQAICNHNADQDQITRPRVCECWKSNMLFLSRPPFVFSSSFQCVEIV